ncbi:UDP-Glycosyltransferase/glycogen phosphorylase [Flavobacterium anhuiense]|uniref:UDP-Glycosyltransferase/glycogen phosphorylase n=1 Tax=Flavobacterium anhuiense TaxID=459526 RepID=A0A444VVV4_9FLAO|nr:UDP-glycosyltransferase [Flavobacterium anhuiense]RYJ37825.1 UDP-Glycosyltransferase/glycogen phosphorylase [Flavobacterium anhuiense]
MPTKKIFILLPDGVGLRNFAFSNFYKIGLEKKFDITYWNNTPFDLPNLGFKEIKINNAKSSPFTDSYKNARKHIELNLNIRRENDKVYDTYRFPFSYKNARIALKSYFARFLISLYNSDKGLIKVKSKIKSIEKKTDFYKQCLQTLERERPNFVFCTNQRPVLAIAPLLAAKELKIPTGTFIFSWDNLPKATMVVETDYYFVWSEHMKSELLKYYPDIKEKQIFVVGTPQFESHFDEKNLIDKAQFFNDYNLDLNKKYICYSGDDITTCPDDPQYLSDVADAVRKINEQGDKSLGLIFRRCPVDFSNRFDEVLARNKDLIVPINPTWKKIGEQWNTVLPTKEDVKLHASTIFNTEMVVNLGSSMVFDYVCFKKPCAYINYDVSNRVNEKWSVSKIYNYMHFRSMPSKKAVIWLNSADEIADKIRLGLEGNNETIKHAQQWFEIINQNSPKKASERIWEAIELIAD